MYLSYKEMTCPIKNPLKFWILKKKEKKVPHPPLYRTGISNKKSAHDIFQILQNEKNVNDKSTPVYNIIHWIISCTLKSSV